MLYPLSFCTDLHLKVNLSVCSVCLEETIKAALPRAPVGFSEYAATQATLYKALGEMGWGDLAFLSAQGLGVRSVFLRKDSISERWTLHVFGETRKQTEARRCLPFPHHLPTINFCQQESQPRREDRDLRFSKIQACLSFSLEFQYSASKVKGLSLEINILLPEGQGDRYPQRYS